MAVGVASILDAHDHSMKNAKKCMGTTRKTGIKFEQLIMQQSNRGRYKKWTQALRIGDERTEDPQYRFFYNTTALQEAILHCGTGF